MFEFLNLIEDLFIFISRFCLPVLCLLLLLSVSRKIFRLTKKTTIARLVMPNKTSFDICGAESILGRSKICDVRLNIPSVSRRHAVLTYSSDYGFKITTVKDSEIFVNDIQVDGYAYLEFGDIIKVGGVDLELTPAIFEDISSSKPKKVRNNGFFACLLLTLVQIILCLQLCIRYTSENVLPIILSFSALIVSQWVYFIFNKFKGIQVELIGSFLTSIGFTVAASSVLDSLYKLLLSAFLGFTFFVIMRFIFRNIELVMKLRYFAGGAAVLLFGYNLIFGLNINGAKNWIAVGPMTIQPSELIKFLFIFAGAATLERLLTTRNLLLYLTFAGGCLGSLALMKDFGTASIFFVTMLIVLYMRSGDLKIISLITAAAGAAAIVVMQLSYVQQRFAAYRHVWEYAASKGYQQTRTMIAIASGGLFGVGAGRGNLDRVAAADTDLVFGMVCEELGIIVGLCVIYCFVLLSIYVFRCTPRTNSTFYAISAVAAAGLFIFQISLNIFGSTDLLPLTGVTLPFISNGGTSMIASWMLLSFFKAIGENTMQKEVILE